MGPTPSTGVWQTYNVHPFWVTAEGCVVQDSKRLPAERRAAVPAARSSEGISFPVIWEALPVPCTATSQMSTGKCPPEPQAQDAALTGHQHSCMEQCALWFHCTTVTSHRLTRASPLTADKLEHPHGWSWQPLGFLLLRDFSPSSLENPGAEPDLTVPH